MCDLLVCRVAAPICEEVYNKSYWQYCTLKDHFWNLRTFQGSSKITFEIKDFSRISRKCLKFKDFEDFSNPDILLPDVKQSLFSLADIFSTLTTGGQNIWRCLNSLPDITKSCRTCPEYLIITGPDITYNLFPGEFSSSAVIFQSLLMFLTTKMTQQINLRWNLKTSK